MSLADAAGEVARRPVSDTVERTGGGEPGTEPEPSLTACAFIRP
ncbi:hypothetical protein [Halolamina sp. CBA1230]|nr:hypothetical protein [Halolamina sp. CBA1230]